MNEQANDSFAKVARRIKKYANKNRRDVEFQVGDKTLLKFTSKIRKKISSKTVHRGLVQKYDGPFEVIKRIGNVAHRLKLPDRLKVNRTFHVSYQKSFNESLVGEDRLQAKRATPMVRKQYDKEVAKIMGH
ncbi:unnamed protein product [Fraxinus pennsylvanica]|uniref:Tf2-1-like SH3-like domain-containing protein n=1 Tax=Fraxinus pennsylvanica TaxID=56036 RepID=A0AAD2DIT1_9LAMI|nr:unnamed protein product [Fraxinus pennsylvanica]